MSVHMCGSYGSTQNEAVLAYFIAKTDDKDRFYKTI